MSSTQKTARVAGWLYLSASVLAIGASLAAAGCGQKGPLYLPEQKAKVVTHPASASASSSASTSSAPSASSSASSSSGSQR
ncbi:MAG TPA: lipoprotein [Steroidobacteraceae bacterium]|nr:lipoprotein [Steroidobacteraceae bacterium]